MRLQAPFHVASVSVDTETYEPDADGFVEAKTAGHVVLLKLHGFVDEVTATARAAFASAAKFGEEAFGRATEFADQEKEDLKKALSDALSANASLQEMFSSVMADVAALKAGAAAAGTPAPSEAAPAPGDTSGSLGQAAEEVKDAVIDLAAATRDDIVAWLKNKGVAVAGNITKEAAVEIAKQNGAA